MDEERAPRKKLYYTLWQKKDIVNEAYGIAHNVRATLHKWYVQPNQIRKWRANDAAEGAVLPEYPAERTVEERALIKTKKTVLTRHHGRAPSTAADLLDQMIPYLEELHQRGIPVSAQILAIEMLCLDPEMLALGLEVIRRRILRFLKKHHLTHRVVTHKAQNIRFHEHVMNDWVTYVNRQIVAGKYEDACIINVDETNVDFDPSPSRTLCKIGERTVSSRISGHSGRCTVMLGCTASGVKFPAFVIWKGVPGGRIDREMRGAAYPHDNIVYAVQPKAWMDTAVYQEWVFAVLLPYSRQRQQQQKNCYLLQDQFSVHLKEENVNLVNGIGMEVDFIPAGYTACLQVMDKGLHKPFKGFLREENVNWLMNHQEGQKPSRVDIANWIVRSWNRVTVSSIVNTWDSLGIRPFQQE